MPRNEPAQVLSLSRGQQAALEALLARLGQSDFTRRFLARDPTLWKDDGHHARVVASRMGWLQAASRMLSEVDAIRSFAEQVRAGTEQVVLLGMGGSSLCPDVLRRTFRRRPGYPRLLVLDSTDPEAVARVDGAVAPERTLFIVSSKSGTTTESRMFHRYFAAKAAPDRFVAITDPGTPLEALAHEEGFRRVFANPPDIGGRYSALSYFGMVPAACAGIDVARLLRRGEAMVRLLRPGLAADRCPPVVLGAALGALARAGRDKVTFVTSPRIATFGYWVEQLLAESTGKEGKGLVPVEGEDLAPPARYGRDRLFVHLKVRGDRDAASQRRLAALRRAGHPCVTVRLEDPYDLGGEFNRWEIATAVAGSVLGIDPFDEPNVQESKDNTARMLERFRATGALPATPADLQEDGVRAWINLPARRGRGRGGLAGLLDRFRRCVRPGDYIALMAYLDMEGPARRRLQALRLELRDRCRAATTLGFGPRFLHSTGQLHKGGAGNGVFLQLTSDKALDLPIPGERFSFGVLQAAQAAGDYLSLASRGYRLMRLDLGADAARGLDKVIAAL